MIISHFSDRENEAQSEKVTGSRSPSRSVTGRMKDPGRGPGFRKSRSFHSRKCEGPSKVQVRVSHRDWFRGSRHLRRKAARACPGVTCFLALSLLWLPAAGLSALDRGS